MLDGGYRGSGNHHAAEHRRPRLTSLSRMFSRSRGVGIGLHQAEDIPLGVFAICQPADAWDGHLWQRDRAAAGLRLFEILINRRGVDCANVGDYCLAIYGSTAREQTAVDARLAIRARFNKPIGLWAVPLRELPIKNFTIEFDGPVRLLSMNLEMNYPWHSAVLSSYLL